MRGDEDIRLFQERIVCLWRFLSKHIGAEGGKPPIFKSLGYVYTQYPEMLSTFAKYVIDVEHYGTDTTSEVESSSSNDAFSMPSGKASEALLVSAFTLIPKASAI